MLVQETELLATWARVVDLNRVPAPPVGSAGAEAAADSSGWRLHWQGQKGASAHTRGAEKRAQNLALNQDTRIL
eukprot:6213489-Pleurochrysis_carterae.AAC.2